MDRSSAGSTKAERFLLTVGGIVLRYGIVLFLVVFGLAKWTRAEALGIQPLVAHSPLMFWIYKLTDVQHGSELIGVTELIIAALMAVRPFKPAFSAVGSLLAIPMFLTTLSFLVTTPGLDPHSADAGFLMKDLILLGAGLLVCRRSFAGRQTAKHAEKSHAHSMKHERAQEETMMSQEEDDYLQMIWPWHLLNAPPPVALSPGYALRTYRPGDEPGFYELMARAGFPEWNDTYLTEWMGRILPESWFMAVQEDTGEIVATAMACHDHSEYHPFGGALGWVAGHPAHSGKGLGTTVSAAVTARLIDAGYRDIHLHTEDDRLAAVKIYLRLGYIPFLYAPGMEKRWQSIYRKLEWPAGTAVYPASYPAVSPFP